MFLRLYFYDVKGGRILKRNRVFGGLILGLVGVMSVQTPARSFREILGISNPVEESKVKLEQQMKSILEEQKGRQSSQVTLSFAGDCTLGTYYGQGEWNRFDKVALNKGYEYFFKNVKPYFEADDLTIVNLEGPLTTGGKRAQKTYAIKGEPRYTQILNEGSIEVVNLANNHTNDYGEEGMKQTKKALEGAEIGYFIGNKIEYRQINGVKLAFIGEVGWDKSKSTKERIKKRIEEAKSKADLVFIMFHWGIEREYYPNDIQKELAYFCIDEGVELVLGSHPHVIQGIETYKGKNIVYSLGNFSFGANKNPDDKDTFVYQATYQLKDDQISIVDSNVIPCSISSSSERNTYQPTPLKDKEKDRLQNRLITYSSKFKHSYFK